jgi:hypothetical protein
MNVLIKLSKEDILTKYQNKPIFIICKDSKNWYIVSDIDSPMPLHMLSSKESDLYDKDKSNIDGIQVTGIDGEGYLMWIYFEQKNGWEAFGYE